MDCFKSLASDLLEIKTENNFKRNEKIIFNKRDEIYHETNNTCHICSKTCINKVRDQCHKTRKNLTIEYLQNDEETLDYCMNEYVILSMKDFSLNSLHYVSLPGFSFDCWSMLSGATLDTLQDE